MRALIADTDAGRRAALQTELQQHGYELHAVDSAAQAPAKARELGALLVCLGGEGALEACRALAAEEDRIVVLAGGVSPLEGVEAGAADVWDLSGGLDTRIRLAPHFARLRSRQEPQVFAREQTARVAAEEAERRSTFLAEASPLLDASLDLRSTLDSLTRLAVPFLGDVSLVCEIHHHEVRRLAAAAADPVIERFVRELPGDYPVRAGDPVARVVETGRAEILTGAGASIFGPAAAGSGPLRADFPRAAMLVPLKARGRIIGIVVLASLDRDRRYRPDELVLAEELARRAALALDNARLYEDLGSVAQALQAALLPQRLPELDGVELAARFRPAGDGSLIGGDFYDVLPRADGIDLVIGDVTGKGARAAALTSLVRHTVRTAAHYEATPSGVLDVVNRTLVAERSDRGRYCTVAFCRIDLNGGMRATICCAGHPMPMVMRGSGSIEHVGRPGSVLGWVDDPKLLDVEFEIEPRESLVLFTDGVTEARTTGDAYGLAGLEELLRAAADDDAAGIAERVDRAAARAGARRDDVAVLVAKRGGTSAG